MSEHIADPKSGSWSSPESNFTIDYALEVLDEIRLAVSSSFHANPRGAVDSAGVFFGAPTEQGVRISAWRPVGLAENDLPNYQRVVETAATDPLLTGLQPVGWFVPHTRMGMELTESDRKIFDRFFPGPRQFTMVLQPALIGPVKATFFVRAGGEPGVFQTGPEFTLEPLRAPRAHGYNRRDSPAPPMDPARPISAAVMQRRERMERSADESPNGSPAEAAMVRVRPVTPRNEPAPPLFTAFEPRNDNKRSRWKWLWLLPVAAILVIVWFLFRDRLLPEPRPATLSVKLEDWPAAQLHVNWEGAAQPIESARRGEIAFEDGNKSTTVDLTPAQLRFGSFAYARRSGSVRVKLSLFDENNSAPVIEEVAEFNGTPPPEGARAAATNDAPTKNDPAAAKQKAALEAEVKRLKGLLATETAKRQELQNLVRVLEARLGIKPGQ